MNEDLRQKLVINQNAAVTLEISSPIRGRHFQIEKYTLNAPTGNLKQGVHYLLEGRMLDSLVQLINAGGEVKNCPNIPEQHLNALRHLNLILPLEEFSTPPSTSLRHIVFIHCYPNGQNRFCLQSCRLMNCAMCSEV